MYVKPIYPKVSLSILAIEIVVALVMNGCISSTPQPTPTTPQKATDSSLQQPTETLKPSSTNTTTTQPTPTATTPRWIEYEKALAKALLPFPTYPIEESGEGLCEWVILGSKENEVYVWAECQVASTASGTASCGPAVIYMSSSGKIEGVAIPRDGTDYGPDIQKLFPPDVQDKINNIESYFDAKAAMDYIALRRKDPTIPPMIVEAGTSLPSPTISPTAQVRPIYYFGHLQMFDANIGWTVYFDFLDKDSKILRTTDGIKTWINVSPSIPESNSLCAAFFMDINTAVVVSCRTFLPEPLKEEVTAWQTTDGGHTWQTGETFLLDQDCSPLGDQIMFLDKDHGWMMCASTRSMHHSWIALFETQDGGMHWKTVYDTPHHLAGPDPLWISGFYPYSEYFTFVTEMTGFFSNRKMFITRDGGKSWLSDPLDPPVDLPDIDCKSDMGECKYLNTVSIPRFTSIQDGVLMRRVYTDTEDASLVFIYNASTVHLPLPKAQYLYYTHDGGQTWIPRPSPAKIGTVYFQDAKRGWFLGKNDPDPSTLTQLYQTADGGTTWKQISSDCALPLGSEIQFVNEKTGFAFETFAVSRYYRDYDARVKTAKSSDIYYTVDGGHSWVKIELQLTP